MSGVWLCELNTSRGVTACLGFEKDRHMLWRDWAVERQRHQNWRDKSVSSGCGEMLDSGHNLNEILIELVK